MLEVFHVFPWVFAVLVGAFGLCIGSFLNVVIHRLPAGWDREQVEGIAEWAGLAAGNLDNSLPKVALDERAGLRARLLESADTFRAVRAHMPTETIVKPRSRCPSCGHGITAAENIPVASWLVLRGKCSACKSPISMRYPLIEAFCGLVSGAIAWQFGPTVQGAGFLLLFFWLVPLAMIDADTQLLPNSGTLPLLWAGLLLNLFNTYVPLHEAVLGAAVGYLFLALPSWIYEWLKGIPEAMGRGDFTLMALLGAWFGWTAILPIVLLSSCVAVMVSVPLMAAGKRDLLSRIPFGPYIAGAGLIYLFFGAALKDLISLPF
jgi:leader peptidase (prepilin peptidase)/N-methyltransferase